MSGSEIGDRLTFERLYASTPADCRRCDLLVIGSGIGLAVAAHLVDTYGGQFGSRIVVVDAGPLDVITHFAHSRFPRHPVLRLDEQRVGGRLTLWGMSAPRPRETELARWPYDVADLTRRFELFERLLGVADVTPLSDRALYSAVHARLRARFPDAPPPCQAPLAINRDGRRWSPVDRIPDLVESGLRLLPRTRCLRLVTRRRQVDKVELVTDRQRWTCRPRFVFLAVGTEQSVGLVRQITAAPLATEAADHHRIDLHGWLPADHFGNHTPDEGGIAVVLMPYESDGVPAHFEVKVAPRTLWQRGYMQSADNLRGADGDGVVYMQVQCVSAMADRLPHRDLLQVAMPLLPVMRPRDARLHAHLAERCVAIAEALDLAEPSICFRPLLTNHHCYGAYRVGKSVTSEFRSQHVDNLFILPPSAFVDVDDDANPTLKSLVLSSFAVDAVARELA